MKKALLKITNKKATRRGTKGAFGCSKLNKALKPDINNLTPEQLNKLLAATGYYNFDTANAVVENADK